MNHWRKLRRGDLAGDSGVTLIEILITIVLLGTIVVTILAATQTSIRTSRTSREAARVESALLTAAERVERASRDDGYLCDLDGPIEAAAQLKLGVSAAEVAAFVAASYEHLTTSGWQAGACPASGFQANLVQRITITMTGPDTGLSRTLEVVKGDV